MDSIVLIKFNSDKTIRGVSFDRDGVSIKASDIHKSLSAKNLAEAIELNRLRGAQQQVDISERNKPTRTPGSPKPKLGKLSRFLDTSEGEEEKQEKKKDFEIGM